MTTAYTLQSLPYDLAALEPHMSRRTLELHHGKHHQAYVNNLNALLADDHVFAAANLETDLEKLMTAAFREGKTQIFNNAAQVWNHDFFWHSLQPNGGGEPKDPAIRALIDSSFGSYSNFAESFRKLGLSQFGSGWVWLCFDPHKKLFSIEKTVNAENPLVNGVIPVLTCDVWEHAYYKDFENRRMDYLESFLTHLLSWDFVSRNVQAFISK